MPYALITGASKGIGKEFAVSLAKRKYNLLLVARTEPLLSEIAKELEEKYKISVQYNAIDLSAADAADDILTWCQKGGFDISVLVNNAGYGLVGAFEKLSLDEQLNMMWLNMSTMVQLTHHTIPLLRRHSGKSYVLNVASTAAYQAIPYLGIYAASKSFVLLFTRALRHEMMGSNVSVTCLSPGAVETHFMERAGMDKMEKIAKQAAKFNMQPDVVAEFGIKAMLNGKAEVIPGFVNKLGMVMTNLLPKNVVESAVRKIYSPEK
ncbi:MAG TPA: SDR family NAD(P)-dependent oxidoreductase [Bacteroidia bacterium]|nr:SDR family NAD(P)-dependent oxidoreductase [Bacteroidia bacterium]